MADFIINGYADNLAEAFAIAFDVIQRNEGTFEIWEIEPNEHGLKYAIITIRKAAGKTPKIAFKQLITRIHKMSAETKRP